MLHAYLSLLGLIPTALAAALPSSEFPTSTAFAFISQDLPSTALNPCVRENYYGAYGSARGASEHIFIVSGFCLYATSAQDDASQALGIPFGFEADVTNDRTIVWVGESGVQAKMEGAEAVQQGEMEGVWHQILESAKGSSTAELQGASQKVLGGSQVHTSLPLIIAERPHSLLISVPSHLLPIFDTLLPAHLSAVALPTSPLPFTTSASLTGPPAVPQHLIDNIANITKHLKFSAEIDEIVEEGLDVRQLVRDVRWLTGESSAIESRHSFTDDAVLAAEWIQAKVQATGAECLLSPFLPGFAPNIICTYPSLSPSSDMVILSAHYDSRGSFGRTSAPGGDDDGSGTAHVLGIAQGIEKMGVRFEKTVVLAFFAGEEQGLLGSAAYAKLLHEQNATVTMHTQADMLGYHDPLEPMQIGFPDSIGLPEAAWLLGNISKIYSPELVVGITSACCSDHQSFVSYGFPATQVFERNGWIADPMYHNSGDVSLREGYDFDQIKAIGKVTFAGLLEVAGYKVKKSK